MHLAQLQALGDGLEVLALELLDLLALLRDLRVELGVLLLDLRVLALVVGVLLVVGGQLRLQPGDGRAGAASSGSTAGSGSAAGVSGAGWPRSSAFLASKSASVMMPSSNNCFVSRSACTVAGSILDGGCSVDQCGGVRRGRGGCLRTLPPSPGVAAGLGCRSASLALGDARFEDPARGARMRRRGGVGSGDGSRDPSGADTAEALRAGTEKSKAAQARKQCAAARQSPREAAHNKETVAV